MATLLTNFKDDILDTSVNTRRKYRMYENTDGTVEFEDVTEYSQIGSEFGAGQINATNTEVNKKFDKGMVVRDLNAIGAMTKEGYVPDALALKEVNESLENLGVSNWKAIVQHSNATDTNTRFNTDISNAKEILVTAEDENRIKSSVTMPIELFKSGYILAPATYEGNNTQVAVKCSYVNDNTINAYIASNGRKFSVFWR